MKRAVTRIEIAIAALAVIFGGWYLTSTLRGNNAASDRARCLENLQKIGMAIGSYLNDHAQTWPYVAKLRSFDTHEPAWKSLPVVLQPYLGENTAVLECPADARELAKDDPLASKYSRSTTWFATEGTSYEWLWGDVFGGQKVGSESLSKAAGFGMGRADQPLLRDFEPFHKGDDAGSFNTLFADLKARVSKS